MNPTTRPHLGSSVSPPASDWRRIGLWLVGATMAYNVLEGVVALCAGLHAGSIALVGFGFDSFIECAAAAALFWRLGIEARRADPVAALLMVPWLVKEGLEGLRGEHCAIGFGG
jgi:divalent metal cation (Fe/Co/Zn/Cd) transporter